MDLSSGEIEASFDTTLSYGVMYRVAAQDKDLLDDPAALNRNNGNRNYLRGIVSNAVKFTSELDVGYDRFGLFLRASGLFDHENENGTRGPNDDPTELSPEAKALVAKDIDLLDAYVTGSFDLGDTALDLRVGKHVLNWGESTFIQSGINAINPYDVSKLRVPGAELREALVPVPMVSAFADLPGNLSLEGFYQLDWQETVIDPVGTYFSVTDYVGPGARASVIPISDSVSDRPFTFGPLATPINADLMAASLPAQPDPDPMFLNVERETDHTPGDSGQWGIAVRYLAEELNNTEFGFYYVNYHSRLPVVSAHQGSKPALQGGLAAASAVANPAGNTAAAIAAAATPQIAAATPHITALVTEQVTEQVTAAVTQAVQAGLLPASQVQSEIARQVGELVPQEVQRQVQQRVQQAVRDQLGQIAPLLAIDRFAEDGHYNVEYAEDIQLFGLSFNTLLGNSGWALQGEYSLRFDAPLQRKEEDLIAAGLGPVFRALALSAEDTASLGSFLASYEPAKVDGIRRANISQFQATATKVFGPILGADSWVFLTEAALSHVHDMPDVAIESSAIGEPADATSYGYRMAARLDYNNAVGAANLLPYVQFRHDINGNSPAPGRPFVKGLTALTLGLRVDYLSRWQGDLSYTLFDGSRNKLRDRDFVTATIKYSF